MLLGATVARAVERGLGPALLDLVPRGDSAVWAWTNILAIACALVAWPVAVSLILRLRRAR